MEATKNGVFFTYEELQNTKPEYLITKAKGRRTFFTKLVEYWANGSYFTYEDERSKPFGETFFIRVNNDGSEDLVELHYNDEDSWFTTIEAVTPAGKAKLWKEAIDGGFMNQESVKKFVRKPKERVTSHRI